MASKPTAEYVEFPIREIQHYCARLLLALSGKDGYHKQPIYLYKFN